LVLDPYGVGFSSCQGLLTQSGLWAAEPSRASNRDECDRRDDGEDEVEQEWSEVAPETQERRDRLARVDRRMEDPHRKETPRRAVVEPGEENRVRHDLDQEADDKAGREECHVYERFRVNSHLPCRRETMRSEIRRLRLMTTRSTGTRASSGLDPAARFEKMRDAAMMRIITFTALRAFALAMR